MALQKVLVVWLDGTFGEKNNGASMVADFDEQITASSQPADPTYAAACNEVRNDLVTNGTTVVPVSTIQEAKEAFSKYPDVKIFFIASGSLGSQIIPGMADESNPKYSFYIFCFEMALHVPWASQCQGDIQMFIHPIDLLVRLMRDISLYFIGRGREYLCIGDGNTALRYFQHAQNLENRANVRDKVKLNPINPGTPYPQPDFRKHLDLLEGGNGLIAQAKQIADP